MPRKKVKSKQVSGLRDKANSYAAMLYFGFAHTEPPFDSWEEGKACWDIVSSKIMAMHPPIGTVTDRPDGLHDVEWGPAGFWIFECPEAPFWPEAPPEIESHHYRMLIHREALIRWGMLPADAPSPGLELLTRTLNYLEDIHAKGREGFTRPWTTVPEKLDQEWELLLARLTAYRELLEDTDAQIEHRQ